MQGDAGRCREIQGRYTGDRVLLQLLLPREMQGDAGRCREMQGRYKGDRVLLQLLLLPREMQGRCRKMQGDTGEIQGRSCAPPAPPAQGDAGRCREMQGDAGET